MEKWKPIKDMPTDGNFYETAIIDEYGERNNALLTRRGKLFFEIAGMYMYYTPTHFKSHNED